MDKDTINIIHETELRALLKGMEFAFDGGREHERKALSHRMKNREAVRIALDTDLAHWPNTMRDMIDSSTLGEASPEDIMHDILEAVSRSIVPEETP